MQDIILLLKEVKNMVTAEKRGNTWRYRFDTAKVDGKRTRVSKGGFRTKKEAIQAGTLAYAQYEDTGIFLRESSMSVSDFFKIWERDYVKINLKPTTCRCYMSLSRTYIIPAIGHLQMKQVSTKTCQDIINNAFNNGSALATLKDIRNVLHTSFDYAVNTLQLIKVNPVDKVKLPSSRAIPQNPQKKKVREAISKEDFDRIIGLYQKDSPMYMLLQLGYRCGLRKSEIMGLSFNDFDEEAHTLSVRKQLSWTNQEKRDYFLDAPKYNSVRTIDLDNFTYQLLLENKKWQKTNEEEYGMYYTHLYLDERDYITSEKTDNEFLPVIRRENGTLFRPNCIDYHTRVIREKTNLPNFDMHTLRHTHTSNLLANGADIVYVQKRLGHKNVQVTLDIYTHITQQMQQKNIDILNSMP
jgi:integrase